MRKQVALLFNIVTALVLIGVLMVYSATVSKRSSAADGAEFTALIEQLSYVAAGMVFMAFAFFTDYHKFLRRGPLIAILVATTAVLIYVLAFGRESHGARRWIDIFGYSVQPSEFAKISVLLFLVAYITALGDRIQKFWTGFTAVGLGAAFFAALIYLEKDMGTPAVLLSLTLILLFLGGARLWHLGLATVGGAVGATLGIMAEPHRLERIAAFRDPWKYRSDEALQLIESLAGFARGGLSGLGPGAGEQKLRWLPEANTDFIYAVIAEEMGLVGSLLVLVLFVALTITAFRIAQCAADRAGYLLASGVGSLIGLEALLNMGVVTGLLPTKGLTLPFISSGGSALLANMILAGILLNVGIQAREEYEPAAAAAVR